jgi:hypothetical protein
MSFGHLVFFGMPGYLGSSGLPAGFPVAGRRLYCGVIAEPEKTINMSPQTSPKDTKTLPLQAQWRSQAAVAFLVLFLLCFASSSAFASYHAVVPTSMCSSNGDGTSWTCAGSNGAAGAYVGLPSTLTRGDVYCLADGNYGNSLNLNTPASGTLTIEIRKAQSYDPNCSGLAGWNTSRMGSAQAVWSWGRQGEIVNVGSGGYYIFNGNGNNAGTTEVGCGGVQANPPSTMRGQAPNPAACGIKIDASTCTATSTDGCTAGVGEIGGNGAGIIWESVEWFGQGLNSNGNNNSEPYFWLAGSPLTNVIIRHSYLHNASTTVFTVANGGWTNGSFDHNYVWGLFDGSTNHGEAIQLQGSNSGDSVNDNIFRDQQTNGDMVAVISGTQSNMLFYNNVDFCSSGGTGTTCRHNDGVIGCYNSQTCSNYLVYNNTFSFPSDCGWNVTGGPSTMTVKNNIWYNCASVNMVGGTNTVDYNSYLNSSQSPVGSHDVSSSSAPNPFVNLPAGNLNLVSENSDWNNRLPMGSPYNTDIAGNTFSTDRGAYQYDGSSTVQPPTGLTATVQ